MAEEQEFLDGTNSLDDQIRYGRAWLERNNLWNGSTVQGLRESYPGGLAQFAQDFEQTQQMSTRIDLIGRAKDLLDLDDDEREQRLNAIAQKAENPLVAEKLAALSEDLIDTRRECQDALRLANDHPDSFCEFDLERLQLLIQDPFVSSWIEEEHGLSTTRGYQVESVVVNVYSALVINTRRVPFIDVDSLRYPRALLNELGSMNLGGKLYRTAKGYRIALAQEISSEHLFNRLLPRWRVRGIDPKYCQVSIFTETYHARLTAKPWRVVKGSRDVGRSYDRYPVTAFVEDFGCAAVGDDRHFRKVMEVHNHTSVTNPRHTLY